MIWLDNRALYENMAASVSKLAQKAVSEGNYAMARIFVDMAMKYWRKAHA